jgi:alpha-glucosidase
VAHGLAYTRTYSAQTVLPYPTVSSAYNNDGISEATTYASGNIDGGGDSLNGEALAAAGLTPGATVTARGAAFTWPTAAAGTPDNVASGGQTIAVTGRGNVLGILGTGTSGSAGGNVTVTYTDGTTATAATGLPNWCCLAADTYGASIVKSVKGRYTPAGLANTTTDYRVYANTIRLNPAKEVAAVTLPTNSAIHVFDLAVGSVDLPAPPPAGTSQVSDLTWLSATNGWGPVEKDMSNGENGAGDGGPLTLDGVVYPKGLGVHAPSTVSYNLGAKCTRFRATVGVDDEIPDYGSIIFTVLVDGQPKQVSPTMDGLSPSVTLDVDVTGATYLDLQVSAGASSLSGDHGDWANATVTCTA